MSAERPGGPGGSAGDAALDDLRKEAESGTIDTVVPAFTDMQGRLVGKRIQADYFLDRVTTTASRAATTCNTCWLWPLGRPGPGHYHDEVAAQAPPR